MDPATIATAVSLTISVVALGISAFAAKRQSRSAQVSNNTLVAVEWLSRELMSSAFLESESYVLDRLAVEHPPTGGVSGLPEMAQHHVHRVGRYYASLGHLAVFGAIDERLVLSIVHYRLRAAWFVIEPYARVERELRQAPFFNFFEHIAFRASEVSTFKLLEELKLRTFPERPELTRPFPGEGRFPMPPPASTVEADVAAQRPA
jgi:hypothetical protein